MRPYFHTITEQNKATLNKPTNSDLVYYSELNSWYTGNSFRSFGLKYVIEQNIFYKIGKKEHAVRAGTFLLGCKQPYVHAYFESAQKVRSICIDICPATISDAFTVLTDAHPDLDNYLAGYFRSPYFFEAVYPLASAPFAQQLTGLAMAIREGFAQTLVHKEWFFNLVEKIIFHEYGNYLALNGIHSVRLETRKEILRRLTIAKQYMDDCFLSIESVQQVAEVCNMSEFHFFRSFRQAFNFTPYQYLLQKRLLLAKNLVAKGDMSITAIAQHCRFPDVFTFSKAFKKAFKTSPSFMAAVDRQ